MPRISIKTKKLYLYFYGVGIEFFQNFIYLTFWHKLWIEPGDPLESSID